MNLLYMTTQQQKSFRQWNRIRQACESEFIYGSMDPEQCFEDWILSNTIIAIRVHRAGEEQRWMNPC